MSLLIRQNMLIFLFFIFVSVSANRCCVMILPSNIITVMYMPVLRRTAAPWLYPGYVIYHPARGSIQAMNKNPCQALALTMPFLFGPGQ